jgi:hydrogenase maturation protein HypF
MGILYEVFGREGLRNHALPPIADFSKREIALLEKALDRGLNAPVTSSAGRLFDAVASLIGLRQRVTFEGQAAIELESVIDFNIHDVYPFRLSDDSPRVVDWGPMIQEILLDLQRGESAGYISAKFHNTLTEVIVEVAQEIAQPRIVLTGGCFQNRYLLEKSIQRLSQENFKPYWHQRVPTNDGGISLGQVIGAARAARATMLSAKGAAA